MVHEQQVVSRWKCKLYEGIGDVLSLAHLGVLKVEGQSAKVFAYYSDGVDLRSVFLLWRHQLVLLVGVRVDFVHVGECDVIAAQKVVLLMRNGFLKQPVISERRSCNDDVKINKHRKLTLLELLLSFLSCSSNTTKLNRKFVMIRRPTRFFWLAVNFFFFEGALIFCAMKRLTFEALAASSSPANNENFY
jgi:hypothetical protein